MQPRLPLAIFLCFAASAFAAAPESVAGFLYTEETVSSVRSNEADAFALRPDGTFRGIYRVTTYGTQTVATPSDGTWSYRKTGPSTAELTLNGAGSRVLTFDTDTRGTLIRTVNAFTVGSFTLTDSARQAPLVNCSNRSFVPAGRTAITGFVLTEPLNAVLIRTVGPGLAAYGVSQFLPAPVLRIYRGNEAIVWDATNGAESLRRTTDYVGAFPLPPGSADAATIVILPAGAYTVHGSGAQASDSGEVLIEAYLVR